MRDVELKIRTLGYLGPNIFLSDSTVAPSGNRDHSAATLEFANDTGPFTGAELDQMAGDLRHFASYGFDISLHCIDVLFDPMRWLLALPVHKHIVRVMVGEN